MSLPQHITKDVGGTVYIDLNDRPENALVSVYKGDGSVLLDSETANISYINTTLNAAVSKGELSVVINDTNGISVGCKFWIQDDPEEVLVRALSGNTVYLRRPLIYDHVESAEVEGTRISYNINSSTSNVLFWDGRCDWNIAGKVEYQTSVECTKYPLKRMATVQDVLDEEPMFYHLIDASFDVERSLDLAHQDVLLHIVSKAPDQRGRVFTGSSEFIQATIFAFFERFYRRRTGEEARALREDYSKKFSDEMERVCQVVPRDANQDGEISSEEKMTTRSIRIYR